LSPDYDGADATPTSETQVATALGTKNDVMWNNFTMDVDCARMNAAYKQHFTMSDGRFATTAQDKKTVDPCFVTLSGDPSTQSPGKFWVEYDVSLFTPQYASESVATGGAGTNKTLGLAVTSANPFLDNTVQTYNQETNPILTLLPATSFPGPNLYKFTRDWSGFISQAITGTTLTGGAGLLKNNGAMATVSIPTAINGAQTSMQRQYFETFKENDLLGMQAIGAAAISSLILNLGGSSVD
jgi:hypothetical protein